MYNGRLAHARTIWKKSSTAGSGCRWPRRLAPAGPGLGSLLGGRRPEQDPVVRPALQGRDDDRLERQEAVGAGDVAAFAVDDHQVRDAADAVGHDEARFRRLAG